LEKDALSNPPVFHCILAVTQPEDEKSLDDDQQYPGGGGVSTSTAIIGYATYIIGYAVWERKGIYIYPAVYFHQRVKVGD